MSLFSVISTVGGLIGSIEADKQRNAALREARDARLAALRDSMKLVEEENAFYQERQRRGDFNPDQALRAAERESALNLRNSLSSQLTGLRNLGYKPGDSVIDQGSRMLSEDAQIRAMNQRIGIQGAFQDRESMARDRLAALRQNVNQTRLSGAAQDFAQANAMPGGNLGGTLASLIGSGVLGDATDQLFGSGKKVPQGAVQAAMMDSGTYKAQTQNDNLSNMARILSGIRR